VPALQLRRRDPASRFRHFISAANVIRRAVPMEVVPLSLRQVEDLLFERGIDIRPETVRRA
jgi:putative transposase